MSRNVRGLGVCVSSIPAEREWSFESLGHEDAAFAEELCLVLVLRFVMKQKKPPFRLPSYVPSTPLDASLCLSVFLNSNQHLAETFFVEASQFSYQCLASSIITIFDEKTDLYP